MAGEGGPPPSKNTTSPTRGKSGRALRGGPPPSGIPRSKLGQERIRPRFLRRLAARREGPGPDRPALPAPQGVVAVIDERGIVDAPQAAVERPQRGQQQGERDAAVGEDPEDRPGGLA